MGEIYERLQTIDRKLDEREHKLLDSEEDDLMSAIHKVDDAIIAYARGIALVEAIERGEDVNIRYDKERKTAIEAAIARGTDPLEAALDHYDEVPASGYDKYGLGHNQTCFQYQMFPFHVDQFSAKDSEMTDRDKKRWKELERVVSQEDIKLAAKAHGIQWRQYKSKGVESDLEQARENLDIYQWIMKDQLSHLMHTVGGREELKDAVRYLGDHPMADRQRFSELEEEKYQVAFEFAIQSTDSEKVELRKSLPQVYWEISKRIPDPSEKTL